MTWMQRVQNCWRKQPTAPETSSMKWMERVAYFRAFLAILQEERPQRQEWVELEGHPTPGWAAYELGEMHKEINKQREEGGLEPVTLRQVRQVEAQAVGHSDYSSKFALYCAELAVGIKNPQP